MNTKQVGEYIKARRTALGFTQKDIAKQFDISFQAVPKWEKGETLPDTALVLDLVDMSKTTIDNILNGEIHRRVCIKI